MSSQARYAQASDVGDILNLTFSGTSIPTQAQAETKIDNAESYIDEVSGHNWRLNNVTDELHDAYGTGFRARTLIVKNKPLISVQKLEWHDGLQWVSGIERHPGSSDIGPGQRVYYVYKPEGKIVWHSLSIEGRQRFRVSYTWGYNVTPKFIKDLSASIAAREILLFWGGQFGPQEDLTNRQFLLDEKIRRLTWQITHRVAGAVG